MRKDTGKDARPSRPSRETTPARGVKPAAAGATGAARRLQAKAGVEPTSKRAATPRGPEYELPEDYEELKKAAHRTSDWKDRKRAVEQLGRSLSKAPAVLDLLTHMMKNDPVYKVQETAYKQLNTLGQRVSPPQRRKGELIKGAAKAFLRVKKSLPEGHSYEEFKEKLKNMRVDLYDTYEGDKGSQFDAWLTETWESLGKKQGE